jgi:DNA-binding transcriptional ArsR family regulator
MTDQEFIFIPQTTTIDFGLMTVESNLNSLALLKLAGEYSGLGQWVETTAEALSEARWFKHRLVSDILLPGVEYDDFPSDVPSYLQRIAAQSPEVTCDRIIANLVSTCAWHGVQVKAETLLSDKSVFIEKINTAYAPKYEKKGQTLDLSIFEAAYPLLHDAEQLHATVYEHLKYMWEAHLQAEWQRNLDLLEACVAAYKQLDYSGMSATEAIRAVTGRDLTVNFPELKDARELVFVPSAHIGPYNSYFKSGKKMIVIFGAKMPQGAQTESPLLDRSELLVQLNALADENRLQILKLLYQHEELFAQDIINMLGLSQSSASRHLRQLTATGCVVERRKDVAKCYTLNFQRIDETTRALKHYIRG